VKRSRAFSRNTVEAAALLGAQIAQARRQRRWSSAELAERAGITAPTLRKVEQGDPSVGLGIAFDVAGLVGVPLFFEEPGRLASEVDRRRELVRLLPQRFPSLTSDQVDDDF
jgi:transcriptional regulator with XRE-family HTH domain